MRAPLFATTLMFATLGAFAQAPRSPTPAPVEAPIRAVKVAEGLENPWSLEFLPDGRMLVAERPGRLRIVGKDGQVSKPLGGLPEVYARGQGGLLDVALSPRFAEDRLVYFSFAEPGEGGAGTAVGRGRFADDALRDVQVVWRQSPRVDSRNHWGSRLVFARDGTLFITTGDRFSFREQAQNLATTIGKVIRINADGSIPKDNPFVGRKDAKPEIWSYGHRNMQGAALDPRDGKLWILMHGARGGDELDQPKAGLNYGWPVITYGRDYNGSAIGIGTAKEGMEQPAYYWDPVIAPSGAEFYTGDRYPGWKNDLFVGSLTPGGLVRLRIEAGRVTQEERYLREVGRVRDVKQGPDGLLYLVIDARNAPLLRVEPTR